MLGETHWTVKIIYSIYSRKPVARGRGRGRGGKGGEPRGKRPAKTAEDLDAEMAVSTLVSLQTTTTDRFA